MPAACYSWQMLNRKIFLKPLSSHCWLVLNYNNNFTTKKKTIDLNTTKKEKKIKTKTKKNH